MTEARLLVTIFQWVSVAGHQLSDAVLVIPQRFSTALATPDVSAALCVLCGHALRGTDDKGPLFFPLPGDASAVVSNSTHSIAIDSAFSLHSTVSE